MYLYNSLGYSLFPFYKFQAYEEWPSYVFHKYLVILSALVFVALNNVITARVRSTREGNVLTRVCPSVCPQGGYPYPIMLCNISQNAMGQLGGVPCQVQLGGYPARSSPGGYPGWGVPWPGGYPGRGGTLAGGTLAGGVPWPGGTLAGGVPWPGGYPGQGGTLARGGTQLGQHSGVLATTAGGMPLAFTQEDCLVSS